MPQACRGPDDPNIDRLLTDIWKSTPLLQAQQNTYQSRLSDRLAQHMIYDLRPGLPIASPMSIFWKDDEKLNRLIAESSLQLVPMLTQQAQRIDQVNSIILLPACQMSTQGPPSQEQQQPQYGPVPIIPGFGGFQFGVGRGNGGFGEGGQDSGGSDNAWKGQQKQKQKP